MAKRNPTIRDIASELDVHFTTVGKALANDPRISEATRERVRRKARQMGYRANPLVSALMAHKRSTTAFRNLGTIAVLIESRAAFKFRSVEVTRRSIERRAGELGFRVEYFELEEYGHSLQSVCKVLRARGIPALLLMSVTVDDISDYDQFKAFCCVSVQEHYGDMPSVLVDHFQCTELLCNEIHRAGYRRPGLIIAPSLDPMGMSRVVAAYRNLCATLFEFSEAPLLLESEASHSELRQWLSDHRPDIVIESWRGLRLSDLHATDPEMAQWLKRFRPDIVPRRRGAAGKLRRLLDPYPRVLLDCIAPGEVGISQNRALTGRKAVDSLVATLNRNERGLPQIAYRIMVEGSWVGQLAPKSANSNSKPARRRRKSTAAQRSR